MKFNQFIAIKKSILLGRKLQREHSEIVFFYLNDENIAQIIDTLNLREEYSCEINTMRLACLKAIGGHRGGFGIEPYEGLINGSETLKDIGRKHRINAGIRLYEEGRGIHGLSSAEKLKFRRKGAQKLKKLNAGIFALTKSEQVSAGIKSALERGLVPWDSVRLRGVSETNYAKKIANNPNFQYSSGPHKGRAILSRIKDEINREYHHGNPIRTENAVQYRLLHY